MTFEKAWQTIRDEVPAEFYQASNSLTVGEKAAAMVTIGCGLSIAYLF